MIRATQNQIAPIARLLTECFIDDPLTVLQTKGIINEKEFLIKLFQIQLDIFEKTRDVYLLDDKVNSVIIGYEKKKSKWLKQIILSVQASIKLRHHMEKNVYELYSKNVKTVSKEIDLNWQKLFIKRNFYHINVIAVAPEVRGKGNARALITPILNYCKENNLPRILETVNSSQIEMYRHLGFELVKTISGRISGLNQYCFIKYPSSNFKINSIN